ncbi:MAG: calcium/sodium antiporter [Bacteroidales bacterium]|jgi:cation:H+ antiporter|nr:calcium/sodium antiporter [Bacteroidales bacterium]
MDLLFLLAGLLLLIFSGDFLVRGSVSLAAHLKVSKLVIGVVIVSIGTSAPELVVSLDAALKGHPDISVGNVVGSNIANIALILGLSAIIHPVKVKRKSVPADWLVMMIASLLLLVFSVNLKLQFFEGILMVLLLTLYIVRSITKSRKEKLTSLETPPRPQYKLWLSLLFVLIASLGLIYGAEFLVKGASAIALKMGVDERVISVSVIALGTSLPELATSVAAAARKEMDVFIGNIIGSNIFNIFAILGITSIITPIDVNPMVLQFDIIWMLALALLLFLFILPLRKGTVSRWKGLVFLSIYVTYIYLAFTTGIL